MVIYIDQTSSFFCMYICEDVFVDGYTSTLERKKECVFHLYKEITNHDSLFLAFGKRGRGVVQKKKKKKYYIDPHDTN